MSPDRKPPERPISATPASAGQQRWLPQRDRLAAALAGHVAAACAWALALGTGVPGPVTLLTQLAPPTIATLWLLALLVSLLPLWAAWRAPAAAPPPALATSRAPSPPVGARRRASTTGDLPADPPAAALRAAVWALGLALAPPVHGAAVLIAQSLATVLAACLALAHARSAARSAWCAGAPLAAAGWVALQADPDAGRWLLAWNAALWLALLVASRRIAYAMQRLRADASTREARIATAYAEQRKADDARQLLVRDNEALRRKLTEHIRFVAAACHDLRQPIHAIGLFAAALGAERLDERTGHLVQRLNRSLAGLDDLFNRLLDISRLDIGGQQPKLATFDVAAMLETLRERFAPLAQQRGLALHVRVGRARWVHSDPALLAELLMNLVSNALRYTQRGAVVVTARHGRRGVRLQVRDSGPGIPEQDLERIFEEFVQLDASARDRRRGLGLGLAIVRRIGVALGSPVTVRSRSGAGSVFELTVPRADAPQRMPSDAPGDPTDRLEGMLVLVVEDDVEILAGMEALLGSWGCFVLLARNALEAAQQLDASPRFPDAVITDHRLSGGQTSDDVIALLERAVPTPVPVIVVSGETSDASAVLAPGQIPVLRKPMEPALLRQVLARHLAAGGR